MKKRQIEKMINDLSIEEILSNHELLQAIANEPETDKEFNRVMAVVKEDVLHADVYRLKRVSHSKVITHGNLPESNTSRDWNSLMDIGRQEAWFSGLTG